MDDFIKYFEDCSIWPTHLEDKTSTFKKLLSINGLFLSSTYNDGVCNEEITKSKVHRRSSSCDRASHIIEDKNKDDEMELEHV